MTDEIDPLVLLQSANLHVGVVQEDDPPTVRDAPVAIVFRVNGGVELIVAADRR